MFSILVSGNGFAWENESVMSMPSERFKEYSGSEAGLIGVNLPESFALLEAADTLLMYEVATTGPNTELVRVGKVSGIRAGRREISFAFKETGRMPRRVILEYTPLLGLEPFEFSRTHWSIKNGSIPKLVREQIQVVQQQYDIALSFAGEDRAYVEKVAEYLDANGVVVFYDRFEEVDLWGKELTEHLDRVYRTGAKFCVMFVSKHYADKMWPNHERRSALAAAVAARTEYILPARFDSTDLPGLRPTIGYINLSARAPEELGALIVQKLRD